MTTATEVLQTHGKVRPYRGTEIVRIPPDQLSATPKTKLKSELQAAQSRMGRLETEVTGAMYRSETAQGNDPSYADIRKHFEDTIEKVVAAKDRNEVDSILADAGYVHPGVLSAETAEGAARDARYVEAIIAAEPSLAPAVENGGVGF